MKVTLLGTSGAEGWPGLFCRCDACAKARTLRGKNIRTRSSSLIDDVLKIDFPPDILHQVIANDLDLRAMSALIFTHGHDDHFSAPELQYLSDYFVTSKITTPLPVYGPSEVISFLTDRFDLNRVPLNLHVLDPWRTVCVAGYRVTPIIAQHDPTQTCYNFIIQDKQGATLLYATDTGWYEEPTWEFLSDWRFDGIVAECSKGPIEGGYMAHMCISEVCRMRRKLIEGGNFREGVPMVTTHHSHLGGLMHHELESILNPEGITTGYDGMSFHIYAENAQRHTEKPLETAASS
jgi:phosphoribosyl 1,2-cyclic phosphate phosphodiesterase